LRGFLIEFFLAGNVLPFLNISRKYSSKNNSIRERLREGLGEKAARDSEAQK
jgi:hypothetical protein